MYDIIHLDSFFETRKINMKAKGKLSLLCVPSRKERKG